MCSQALRWRWAAPRPLRPPPLCRARRLSGGPCAGASRWARAREPTSVSCDATSLANLSVPVLPARPPTPGLCADARRLGGPAGGWDASTLTVGDSRRRQHTDRRRACTRPGMRGELKKRAEMERMREQMFGDDSDGIPVFTVYVRSKKGQVWCTGSQGMRFDAACTRRNSRRVLARMNRGNRPVVRAMCARDDSR